MWAEMWSMNYLTIINILLLIFTMWHWWDTESILSLTVWFSWMILLDWHKIELVELQRNNKLQLNKSNNTVRSVQRTEDF